MYILIRIYNNYIWKKLFCLHVLIKKIEIIFLVVVCFVAGLQCLCYILFFRTFVSMLCALSRCKCQTTTHTHTHIEAGWGAVSVPPSQHLCSACLIFSAQHTLRLLRIAHVKDPMSIFWQEKVWWCVVCKHTDTTSK